MSCYGCKDVDKKRLTPRLNKRVTIQKETLDYANLDGFGQPTKTITDIKNIWVAIEPLRGQEYYEAYRLNVDVTTRIRSRYYSDIDRTMIIKYVNQGNVVLFEILDVINPNFANKELQLMCKERQ